MKKKELSFFKTKDIKDLEKLVEDKKLELSRWAAKESKKGGKNVKKGKNLKVEIAQILTIKKEKEIALRIKK